MPGLIPILVAGSQLLLVADPIPKLNVEASCRAASGAAMPGRDENACKRDEQDAHDRLRQQWRDFSDGQRSHCVRLTGLGGSPSYVELLTCLELAKQSAALPPEGKLGGGGTRP